MTATLYTQHSVLLAQAQVLRTPQARKALRDFEVEHGLRKARNAFRHVSATRKVR
jgi:hypothetical protein